MGWWPLPNLTSSWGKCWSSPRRVRGAVIWLQRALCENMLSSACEYTNLLQIAARVPLKRSGSHSTCLGVLEAFTKSVLSVLCQKKILLNTFLDVLMADPPPQCLVWIPLMHRLANVENGTWVFYILFPIAHCVWTPRSQNMAQLKHGLWLSLCCCPAVFHPVECSYCQSESMMGFRYRCPAVPWLPALSELLLAWSCQRVPIATSTRWRSTPHGYVHPKMEIRLQFTPNLYIISLFQETQKEMLCRIFKLFFSL